MASYTSLMGNLGSPEDTKFLDKNPNGSGVISGGSVPVTPSGGSVRTTPSSATSGFHSLYTPPSVCFDESSSLLTSTTIGGSLSLDQIFKSAAAHLVSPLPFSNNQAASATANSPSSDELTAAAASLLSCLAGNNLYTNTPSFSSRATTTAVLPTPPSCSSIKRQASSVSSTSNNSSNNPMIQSLLSIPQNQLTASCVAGRVMELATDRNGSRLLQKLLTQGGVDIVSRVVDEVEHNLTIIMCDTYANYMCQQLFQAASANQRLRLLTQLSPRFVEVAKDRRGTHSLQALISHISTTEEEAVLANTIRGKVELISLDVHATHVLQQAISCCLAKSAPRRHLDFVFEEVAASMDRLAVDPNALGVVKRCITHSQSRGFAKDLAEKLDKYMFIFVENPYANYAVQHALETWSASRDDSVVDLAERLVLKLEDKIAPMALHKFASNVAEMAIKSSRPSTRRTLIESLHYDDDARILSLMRSPFGVFVVGTAIKYADDLNQSHGLTMAVYRNMKKLPDGRNRNKWEKLLSECSPGQSFSSSQQ